MWQSVGVFLSFQQEPPKHGKRGSDQHDDQLRMILTMEMILSANMLHVNLPHLL